MAQYPNLAELRGELTDSDPDDRGQAYSAVYEADVQPSEVLNSDPTDETVQKLVSADVIPENTSRNAEPAYVTRERMVELLEQIAANTGGA